MAGIEADLGTMPESVREHLGGIKKPAIDPEARQRVGNPERSDTRRVSAAAAYEGQGITADPLNPAFQRAAFALSPDELLTIEKSPGAVPKTLDI